MGWWPSTGSKSARTLVDLKNRRYPGAVLSGVSWINDPVFGPVLSFPDGGGLNESVELTVCPGSAFTKLTVVSRVYFPTAPDNYACIAGKLATDNGATSPYNIWALRTTNAAKWRGEITTSGSRTTVASADSVPTGKWVIAALVYDGSDIYVYEDGVEKATTAKTGTLDTAAFGGKIGNWGDASYADAHGDDKNISDVLVYNRALAISELKQFELPRTRWDLYLPVRRVWAVRAPAVGEPDLSVQITPDASQIKVV